jgi:hypothetical protein
MSCCCDNRPYAEAHNLANPSIHGSDDTLQLGFRFPALTVSPFLVVHFPGGWPRGITRQSWIGVHWSALSVLRSGDRSLVGDRRLLLFAFRVLPLPGDFQIRC